MEVSHKKLKDAYDELQTLDKMKGDILSNVSHELRTPLTSIMWVLDMLEDEDLNGDCNEFISLASRNADRLDGLIEDLLYYAKMEYSGINLEKVEVNISKEVEAALRAVSLSARKKSVDIKSVVEGDFKVLADRRAVRKVLLNLLNNAIKFNKEGGKIFVCASERDDGQVIISIEDTGIGIIEKNRDKIFDRLYQVDGSTKRNYAGTGMGLSIAKGIIEKHGENMMVESNVGVGSKFTFSLPRGFDREISNIDDLKIPEISGFMGLANSSG